MGSMVAAGLVPAFRALGSAVLGCTVAVVLARSIRADTVKETMSQGFGVNQPPEVTRMRTS